MFNKILVPLDGSKLAECALSYAEELAVKSKAELLGLISVTERITGKVFAPEARELFDSSDKTTVTGSFRRIQGDLRSSVDYIKDDAANITFGKMERQADRYLHKVSKRLEEKGIPVATQVLIGNVAEQITQYAEQNNFEIIVMSSHGRSGPSRWAYGSITDKILKAACIPILVVRAPGCFPGI